MVATQFGWSVAEALWLLLPLLLISIWFRARQRTITVASTAIWREVRRQQRSRARPSLLLLFIATLIVLLAGPVLRPTPPSGRSDDAALRVIAHGGDATDPDRTGPIEIVAAASLFSADRPLLEAELRSWSEPPVGSPASVRVPLSPPDDNSSFSVTRVEVPRRIARAELTVGERSTRVDFPGWTPTVVHDDSGSAAVANALLALEASGYCRRAEDDAAADVWFVRAGAIVPSTVSVVSLPRLDARVSQTLPLPDVGVVPDPLVRGLHPDRWSVAARLDSPTSDEPERVVLDSTGGPLIRVGSRLATLAFDPDASAVSAWPAWPIFVGRLLEHLDPAPSITVLTETSEDRWPRSLPTIAVGLLCGLLGWRVVGHERTRVKVMIGIAIFGLAFVPSIPYGEPRRTALDVSEARNPMESWYAAAERVGRGGVIEVAPDAPPLPLEEQRIAARLRSDGIGVDVRGERRRTAVRARPDRVEIDGTVTLTITPAATVSLNAIGPHGDTTELLATDGRVQHRPDVAGFWRYRIVASESEGTAAPAVGVLVTPRLRVVAAVGPDSAGLAELIRATGQEVETIVDLDATALESARLLLWDGSDPARWPPASRDAVRDWVANGGVLAAVAGPPFVEPSDGARQLGALLPGELPPPPRRRSTDYGVILLDVSGSVAGDALTLFGTGLRSLFEATPTDGRWGVATFRATTSWWVAPGTPIDDDAIERLAGVTAGGGTRLDRALDFALTAFDDEPESGRQLIVLTDGRTRDAKRTELWTTYGEALRERGIGVSVLATGANDSPALRKLVETSGGELRFASRPEVAARLLAEAVRRAPGPWRAVVGPLTPIGRESWLSTLPREIPAPTRRFVVTPHPEAIPVLRDRTGAPLLATRPVGRGRSFLLNGGLDRTSLPSDAVRDEFGASLAAILLGAARESPSGRRRTERRIDAAGRSWLLVERTATEPSTVESIVDSQPDAVRNSTAIPHDSSFWRLRLPDRQPHVVRLEIGKASNRDATPTVVADSSADPGHFALARLAREWRRDTGRLALRWLWGILALIGLCLANRSHPVLPKVKG